MPKKSFTLDIKMLAFQYLEEGRHTFQEIATMFTVNVKTLQMWRALYKFGGTEALIRSKKNNVYAVELKKNAVEDYLAGTYSMYDILKYFYYFYCLLDREQFRCIVW